MAGLKKKKKQKKRKENEESLEIQSLAKLKKKKNPTISIPPPKQKILLEKPLRQESPVKPFNQIHFL